MNLERFIVALGPSEVAGVASRGAVAGPASIEIADLAYDTRTVAPGALFFCVRGRTADGHDLAPAAAERGAAALVVDHAVPVDLPQLVV
ncbi:MAG TPA: Mur ligase domain-containing protein, partial [Gaiellaceae bacterium]|nr:Mur ligase domain-containing protein [Gaiellaceae bacterium]